MSLTGKEPGELSENRNKNNGMDKTCKMSCGADYWFGQPMTPLLDALDFSLTLHINFMFSPNITCKKINKIFA